MRQISLAACCVVVFARALAACECIGEARQIPSRGEEELSVTEAVLTAYFNQIHGIGSRDLVALYYTTLKLSPEQLEVRVFSPQNDATKLRPFVAALLDANEHPVAIPTAPPQFIRDSTRSTRCDGKLRLADAVAVSRPAISGDGAVIYLEYHGGARAYHLVRSAGRWSADWYVDLWQCG